MANKLPAMNENDKQTYW